MTRKRFMKLAMSEGMTRDEAKFAAQCTMLRYSSYEEAYFSFFFSIRGRFEMYMPGHEKKLAKRNKRLYG